MIKSVNWMRKMHNFKLFWRFFESSHKIKLNSNEMADFLIYNVVSKNLNIPVKYVLL